MPRQRPIPAGGRPKPKLVQQKPKARALYPYDAADTDEITIREGEIIEVMNEGN